MCLLVLNSEGTLGKSPDSKREERIHVLFEAKPKADGEVTGVTARASPDVADTTALPDGVVQCFAQPIRDQPERIDKIALS